MISPLKELENFGEIYSEKYMKECSTLIEQQDFHQHREPREKVVTEEMYEPIQKAVKKMAEPRRPKGWEKELFKFLQDKQKLIVEKMGPEEFLNCSIIRVRMRVDSVIYHRKRFTNFRRDLTPNEKETLKFILDNLEALGMTMESFKHKFYSYMEREDFFSITGFVAVMGEKLKGFKK